jgi:aerobic carbon-monoxide dehydrogenase medium subunit
VSIAPFALHRPRSVEEATALLDELGEEAHLYGGGTELLLVAKLGFARFDHLVDTKAIGELDGISLDGDVLVIGARMTHRQIERAPLVLEHLPALAAMERQVANIRVRSVGTLAGNLCFSDPHSDPATFLIALDAEIESRRGDGPPRRRPVHAFVRRPYQPELDHGELVVSVRVPIPVAGTAVVHRKFSFHERPAATVTCAVRVVDGTIADARIAVGSVGNRVVRAYEAEALLVGASPLDDGALAAAGRRAAELSNPVQDANGSPEYKAQLVDVLVRRAFREAVLAA